MGDSTADPLALGQRIVAILESGARVATYKLATLSALMDVAVERLPAEPDDTLVVPIPDLAQRVIELYWPQVRPFDGSIELRQTTGTAARILREVAALRAEAGAGHTGLAVETARLRIPERFVRAVDEVALTLARQPLHRLQKVGLTHDPFLYDDSWLHDQVGPRQLRAHGNAITLRPGVAHALARLSGLLKPALEILWVDDVRRMNRLHFEDRGDDLAAHLFGRDRINLAPVRSAFGEAFGPHCFYCGTRLRRNDHIDHVLPWSRVGIDGLANLVLACQGCNTDKRHALPSLTIVDRVLERDHITLDQIATEITWPTQYDRVRGSARGIYLGEPAGVLTWDGRGRTVRLDLGEPPDWLRLDWRDPPDDPQRS